MIVQFVIRQFVNFIFDDYFFELFQISNMIVVIFDLSFIFIKITFIWVFRSICIFCIFVFSSIYVRTNMTKIFFLSSTISLINFSNSISSIRFVVKRKLSIDKCQNLISLMFQFISTFDNRNHDKFKIINQFKSTFRKFSLKNRLLFC